MSSDSLINTTLSDRLLQSSGVKYAHRSSTELKVDLSCVSWDLSNPSSAGLSYMIEFYYCPQPSLSQCRPMCCSNEMLAYICLYITEWFDDA